MTVIRPSARIRFTIRTEEFAETAALEALLPPPSTGLPDSPDTTAAPSPPSEPDTGTSSETALAANQERRTALEAQRGVLPPEAFARQMSELDAERTAILRENADAEATTGTAPDSVEGPATDDLTVLGEIEPNSLKIERNGLATADTASVSIQYQDAPIDPTIVRAAHIQAVIGVVPPAEYEGGIERGEARDDGSLLSLVPSAADAPGISRFVGFVDDWSVNYSDGGDSIELEARDMSAPLRDIQLPSGASIDLSLPLDQGITSFLNSVSATTRGVTVVYEGDGTAPTPSVSAPTRRRGRRGRVARRARRGNQRMTLWDHITDVVRSQGLLNFMRGFELVISEPRTLDSSAEAPQMIYGRNLEKLEFKRKLSGVKVPTIEVRCLDPERGRTLWARWPIPEGAQASGVLGVDNPPRALRANEVPPSGSNPDETIRTIVVSGVTDPAVLARHARSIFEEIGKQEIQGSFTTNDVSTYDEDPELANLLSLRAGDPVELLVAGATPGADEDLGAHMTVSRIRAMDRQRRTAFMVSRGWARNVAERFAALQDASGFQTVFRVQNVRFSWDRDSGLRTVVDFINYITIREEPDG